MLQNSISEEEGKDPNKEMAVHDHEWKLPLYGIRATRMRDSWTSPSPEPWCERPIKAKGWTPPEILSNAVLFILASFETTASVLQFLIYELAKNPEIQEDILKEIKKMEKDRGPRTALPADRTNYR